DALTRRGCGLGSSLLALAAPSPVASGSPPALVPTIVKAAVDGVSPSVAALARGVFPMALSKRTVVAVVLLVGLMSAGIGWRQLSAGAQEKPAAREKPRAGPRAEERKPKPDGQTTITGQVLDPAGKPVSKAVIYLFR